VSNLWQRLVELWRGAGVTIRPPATLDAIQAFESNYGIVLPDDMRAYFLTVDGMEGEFDSGTNRFWPISMVKPVEEELSEQHMDQLAYWARSVRRYRARCSTSRPARYTGSRSLRRSPSS